VSYARRTDANHGEIRDAFRKLGCRVFDACRVGQGFPDLVVQYGGMTLLVEVKTRTGTLTDAQEGSELMAKVVRDMDDVADAVATLKRWCEGVRSSNPLAKRLQGR
jgi:Holliday junction resolvase-like predicted endonuclease